MARLPIPILSPPSSSSNTTSSPNWNIGSISTSSLSTDSNYPATTTPFAKLGSAPQHFSSASNSSSIKNSRKKSLKLLHRFNPCGSPILLYPFAREQKELIEMLLENDEVNAILLML